MTIFFHQAYLIGGDLKTSSPLCYHNGMIWFREDQTDRLMVMQEGKPKEAVNPYGLKTLSEPVLVKDRYIAFRGENDKLMLITCAAPRLYGQLGNETCLSAPIFGGGYLYFQGPANSLVRCGIERDTRDVLVASDCLARPALSPTRPDYVYYLGVSEDLGEAPRQVNWIDTRTLVAQPVGAKNRTYCDSTNLFVTAGGMVWTTDRGRPRYLKYAEIPQKFYSLQQLATAASPARFSGITPPVNDDAYYIDDRNLLYRLEKRYLDGPITDGPSVIGNCGVTPDVHVGNPDAFAIYAGTDKKIYKVYVEKGVRP
jgi:hypothetical protein